MKLNFWQWLGVVLLIIGSGLWIYRTYFQKPDAPRPDPKSPPPAVQPVTPPLPPPTQPAATQPATQPA